MADKPEFFWSPPDGAPIVGLTQWRGNVVVATATGVWVIVCGNWAPDQYTIHKISMAVQKNEEPDGG